MGICEGLLCGRKQDVKVLERHSGKDTRCHKEAGRENDPEVSENSHCTDTHQRYV